MCPHCGGFCSRGENCRFAHEKAPGGRPNDWRVGQPASQDDGFNSREIEIFVSNICCRLARIRLQVWYERHAIYIWSNSVYFILFQMASPQTLNLDMVEQSTFVQGFSIWRLDIYSRWPESILLSLRPSMEVPRVALQMPICLPGASATLRPTSSRCCCHARQEGSFMKISNIIAHESQADKQTFDESLSFRSCEVPPEVSECNLSPLYPHLLEFKSNLSSGPRMKPPCGSWMDARRDYVLGHQV